MCSVYPLILVLISKLWNDDCGDLTVSFYFPQFLIFAFSNTIRFVKIDLLIHAAIDSLISVLMDIYIALYFKANAITIYTHVQNICTLAI